MAITLAEMCDVRVGGDITLRRKPVPAAPVTAAQRRAVLSVWPRPHAASEVARNARGEPVHVARDKDGAYLAQVEAWAARIEVLELAIAIGYRTSAGAVFDPAAGEGPLRAWLDAAHTELTSALSDAEIMAAARAVDELGRGSVSAETVRGK